MLKRVPIRIVPASECKSNAAGDSVHTTIREEDVDAGSGVEIPDPESSACCRVPPAWRLAVQINAANVREAKHADVEREDQGKFRDGDPQLCASVDRRVANVP